jgi:zona occludens toxin (predicted ATPase)
MRKFLLLLALLVLAAIGVVWAGIVDLNWNGNADAPVEVKINPVELGTEERQVQTPTIRVKDGNGQQAAPPAAQPPQPAPAPTQGNKQ